MPDKNAPDADIRAPIEIVFSEDMLVDTIKGAYIKLLDDANKVVEGTTVALDKSDKKKVTITHQPLQKGKKI